MGLRLAAAAANDHVFGVITLYGGARARIDTDEVLLSVFRENGVFASRAGNQVVPPGTAVQRVALGLTVGDVIALSAIQGIPSRTAIHLVVSGAAAQLVIAQAAEHGIVFVPANNYVVALVAAERVSSILATYDVVPTKALDGVGLTGADQEVGLLVPLMVAASATPLARHNASVINVPNNIALRMPLSLSEVVSGIYALASRPLL